MKLVNLTPHAIRLVGTAGDVVVSPSGKIARVESTAGVAVGEISGVPIYSANEFGEVIDLPEPTAETIYIVSAMVAGRVPHRGDVVSPGTGPNDGAIREGGRIIAVTRLISSAKATIDQCIYCRADCGPVSPITGRGLFREGWDCPVCGGN